MARPSTRSPTPVGSHKYRRDDRYSSRGDSYRDRRRSRSPPRRDRERDRDYYDPPRRDRSRDRRYGGRDDRSYRPHRDRSRDRKRSRDRSPPRDHRRRDDSRDRVKRRRDDSTDSRRTARRDPSPARSKESNKPSDAPPSSTPADTQTPEAESAEARKQAERLKRTQLWKAKIEAQKKEQELKGGAREILEAMDRKTVASPTAVASPQSPAPALSPVPAPAQDTSTSPPKQQYTGKFDPKAIAKRATGPSTIGANALGGDVAVPFTKPAAATIQSQAPKPGSMLKAKGNVGGFGFGPRAADTEKPGAKKALDLEDEESTRKKLEKLPTPDLDDAAVQNDEAEQLDGADDSGDDDTGMADGGTEEEQAAAARAAAEKREERMQLAKTPEADTAMTDAPQPVQGDEEDVDPLDAFMSGLSTVAPKRPTKTMSKSGQKEPIAMYGDDDDPQEAAIDSDPEDVLARETRKKAKATIGQVDHKKMSYKDVRFNFYTEPLELAAMDEDAVSSLRFELDGIKVMGREIPKPISAFAQCGLGLKTLDVLRHLDFDKPTSIQAQAIPTIMSGRDLVAVAKTGSGKTLAFLLPMFRHIMDQDSLKPLDGPISVIMAPTRELAAQIAREARPFARALNLRVVVCGGGAPIKDQIAELKKGAEIIIATPGRLIELLGANSGRVTNLARVTYVVLDEADRMFDLGFKPQISRILSNVRPKRQTVLFSATFPGQLELIAKEQLNDPVTVIVGERSTVASEVTQVIEIVEEDDKFNRLLGILGDFYKSDDDSRTLIFVKSQQTADKLLDLLLKKYYSCDSIHGAKDQVDRDSALSDFKKGAIPILIATSVAARGLDVKQLRLVIQYDAPDHLEDYVHRAGRTGRAGNKGTAITFISPRQAGRAREIAKAFTYAKLPIPENLAEIAEKAKGTRSNMSKKGFMGKSLDHYDKQHEAARKAQKSQYKMMDGDEDDDEEQEEAAAPVVQARTPTTSEAAQTPTEAKPAASAGGFNFNQPIKVYKTEQPEASASKTKSNDPLERVRAAASKIDGRLTQRNQLRPGQPIDNKGPDAGAYHATLEINDYPQKARWAVTNRTNVAKILEATGTSITTKGNFYTKGDTPGPEQPPKLYILVEGDTEIVVQNAMRELMRLLKEGTVASQDTETRGATGKYNVV
ncbi:pre-mrna-processing atp-dependent rna helicase prp5 [Diplodia corticola]|uniref:RNA helicase n=1 Tax=Diplodia corticola TaxID=236234 RepID=A0A1J9SG69_9PEZI|nr:pre-mrna-processing atp-dependent rna helicase prp5 [Diplodia corticola]OJD38804.1 pre-mrna-processing atp-dependent rna helicase prp5 [Diplodia corticola]